MIADTSFIIDILNGDHRALRFLEILEAERQPEKISAITVLELYEGIMRSSKPKAEKTSVLQVLESKHVVPADLNIMKRAATLSELLITEGRRIDREDCVIAATALSEGDFIVTKNPDHFERIPGVEARTY